LNPACVQEVLTNGKESVRQRVGDKILDKAAAKLYAASPSNQSVCETAT